MPVQFISAPTPGLERVMPVHNEVLQDNATNPLAVLLGAVGHGLSSGIGAGIGSGMANLFDSDKTKFNQDMMNKEYALKQQEAADRRQSEENSLEEHKREFGLTSDQEKRKLDIVEEANKDKYGNANNPVQDRVKAFAEATKQSDAAKAAEKLNAKAGPNATDQKVKNFTPSNPNTPTSTETAPIDRPFFGPGGSQPLPNGTLRQAGAVSVDAARQFGEFLKNHLSTNSNPPGYVPPQPSGDND